MATILLVVDELPLLRLYEGALTLEHDVVALETMNRAQHALGQVRPDVIVYDLNRTNFRNTASLEMLNRTSRQADIPLLVMADKSHHDHLSLDEFVGTVLPKPVTVSVLRRSVKTALTKDAPAEETELSSGNILSGGIQPV